MGSASQAASCSSLQQISGFSPDKTVSFPSAMVVISPECEGVWVWSTCTLTVSINEGTSYLIKAAGDLGWRVQGTYVVGEDGELMGQEMKAVCQPLQDPGVEKDEN